MSMIAPARARDGGRGAQGTRRAASCPCLGPRVTPGWFLSRPAHWYLQVHPVSRECGRAGTGRCPAAQRVDFGDALAMELPRLPQDSRSFERSGFILAAFLDFTYWLIHL